jgi:hypothetical protein
MSLNAFLFTLIEGKEVGSSCNVQIVQDNAKTDDCRRVILPKRAEREPRCRWSKLKRQESDDSCLIQPLRVKACSSDPSLMPQRAQSPQKHLQTRNDRMKTSFSDPSLLRMPRRVQSPQRPARRSAASQADTKNATWDSVDLNQISKKKADSKKLFSLLLTPARACLV